MVKYRLKFQIYKDKDKSKNRDSTIDMLLSNFRDIVTDVQLKNPSRNDIIAIDGVDYDVVGTKSSFTFEEEITWYDTIIFVRKLVEEKVKEAIKVLPIHPHIQPKDKYSGYPDYFKRRETPASKNPNYDWWKEIDKLVDKSKIEDLKNITNK